ncbi:MAG TPA: hypothetical protein VGC93_17325 [Thermoanaerobaculia bacterium]
MTRNQNRTRPLAAALALVAALAAAPAFAHQCVDVDLLRAPDAARPGGVILVEGSVTNCGEPARGFLITWWLVGDHGDRHLLRRAVSQVRPDQTLTGTVRLMIPVRIRPGVYDLVMLGEAPSGFTDSDAQRIAIRHPTRGPTR